MVYGLSYLYGLYGTLSVPQIGAAMAQTAHDGCRRAALLAVAIFGLIVGIGFKISAVPFHFWCPDVFEGASIEVTTFLSVASKGAALVLSPPRSHRTARTASASRPLRGVSLVAIAAVVGVMGAVTCTVGNTGALVQNNIKRLLAYSSISHAGYMLCALSLLVKYKADVVGAHGSTSKRTPPGDPALPRRLPLHEPWRVHRRGAGLPPDRQRGHQRLRRPRPPVAGRRPRV
jgi:NADH:ubiquinone oxidoreductase subunit 2 (subunit N)